MRFALDLRISCVLLLIALVAIPTLGNEQPKDAGNVVTYAAWSTRALYLAFRVDDTMILGNQSLWLGQPWQDDAVAVYLDFRREKQDSLSEGVMRVVLSAAGGATVQRGEQGEWHDDPAWFDPLNPKGTIRYGVKMIGASKINDNASHDEGYVVELALSWEQLGTRPPMGQGLHGELPTIGFAIANYSQGETQAVSCWPEKLAAEDLNHPLTWGTLEFTQNLQPVETVNTTAKATLLPRDLQVDGKLDALEWMTAGVVKYPKQWGTTTLPVKQGRQMVSLIAAFYQLDPFASDAFHQPLEPMNPWYGPDTPYYHLKQIIDARQAGIDAFAVALPVDPQRREQTRARLLALRQALNEYMRDTAGTQVANHPLLLPVLDFTSIGTLDLRKKADATVVEDALADFYRLIPPQLRVMASGENDRYYYPVVLANPGKSLTWDDACLERLSQSFPSSGTPLGWILDSAWNVKAEMPNLLTRCTLDPANGLQLGDGPMFTALVAPGASDGTRETLPRRNGDTFTNSWMKIFNARPDMVLIRSWNDFQRGTEIAASRTEGYLYPDTMQVNAIRLAQERGFGIRMLNHNIPATLLPGKSYPVEILVKNGSVEKIVTEKGFRVDYRVTRNGETVLAGDAGERLLLIELAMARIRFTLTTGKAGRAALRPGEYQLHLDFRRNKVPIINTTLLRELLGTVTVPFTVSNDPAPVQLVANDLPEVVPANATTPGSITLRNTTKTPWRKGQVSFSFRWMSEQGDRFPGEKLLPCKNNVASGELVTIQGMLPPAPPSPGWYLLTVEMQQKDEEPIRLAGEMIRVTRNDSRAAVTSITMPRYLITDGKPVEASIMLRNVGLTPLTAKGTKILYQWLTWDGQPIPGADGSVPLAERMIEEELKSGEKTALSIPVTPPEGAGSFRCAFGVEHAGEVAAICGDAAAMSSPLFSTTINASRFRQIDLSFAYTPKQASAYANTIIDRPDFDGDGNAFPLEEFLPDFAAPPMGYQPGYQLGTVDVNAPSFRFGNQTNRLAPVVRATGQAIALPDEPASAIYLVATNIRNPYTAKFTVRYADNTEQQTELTIANWLGNPVAKEPVMLRTKHIHTQAGDNWYLQGSLFVYKIPLDPARKPAALFLPNSPAIAIFAMTLEMGK